jgi:hypothetical protein
MLHAKEHCRLAGSSLLDEAAPSSPERSTVALAGAAGTFRFGGMMGAQLG